jgi:hypothetical protein
MKQRVNPSTLTPERRGCPTEMQSIEDSTRQSQSIRYRIRQAVDGKQCPAWFLREVIPRWIPYWLTDSNWQFRFDEKNCCEDHTCQDESGSEFKRLQETHHSVTTQLEKYRPNRSLCGCINGALHGWISLWHELMYVSYESHTTKWMYQQCTTRMHCMNLTKAMTRYARTLKSNKGYYKHRLVAKMYKDEKTAKQACFSSPH